jgi:hypothetical protein
MVTTFNLVLFFRLCQPPDGVWDVLHETCIQVTHDEVDGTAK